MQSLREWLIRIYRDYTQNMAVISKHRDAKECLDEFYYYGVSGTQNVVIGKVTFSDKQ